MTPRQVVLARRKQALHERIAMQRNLLVAELDAFRGPMRAFEVARRIGEQLRRYAPLIGGVAAGAAFVLMRGGAVERAVRTVRLARRATSLIGVARIALRLIQGRPLGRV